MKKKNNPAFILMIILLVVLAAASGIQANRPVQAEKEYIVSIVLSDSANPKWQNLKAGMRAAAREKGLRLNILTTNASTSSEHEAELVNTVSEHGSDAVIIEISDSRNENTFLTNHDIPTVYIENPLYDDTCQNVYTIDNKAAAKALFKRIMRDKTSEAKEIAIINHHADMLCNEERLKGIQEEAEKNNYTIIWQLNGPGTSTEKIQQTFNDHPAAIIIALDNDSTEMTIDALGSSAIQIYGFGNSPKCIYNTDLEVVSDLIVSDSYVMGYEAVMNAWCQLTHQELPEISNINYRIITKANLFTEKNQHILFPVS